MYGLIYLIRLNYVTSRSLKRPAEEHAYALFFYLFVFLSFVRIYIEKCDIFAMREDDISI